MIISEEHRQLQIGKEAIPITLLKGRPNRIRLSFDPNNHLRIETGNGKLGDFERNFIATKTRWILKGYRIRRDAEDRKRMLLSDVERIITIFGKDTEVTFTADNRTYFKYQPGGAFQVFAPPHIIRAHKKKVLYFALRKFAELYLNRKVTEWAAHCGMTVNRVVIKDLKSKWGSCSTLRNVNLNWHLILLEEPLIDYVVVHELMHLHEMNHSTAFWSWVSRYCPDYKELRKQLKEKQWLVGILN